MPCSAARRASVRSVSSHQSSLLYVAKLRQVGEREQHVVRAGLRQQLERPRVDDLLVRHRPGVERVAGVEIVGELCLQCGGELGRQRLERDARRLGVVGEQRALATRLGDRGDTRAARPAAAAEDLERLDELVEVLHLDRSVAAQHGRERAHRADECSRVRQRGARGCLGAPHLEADDRLARRRARRERLGEGGGAAYRLEEEAHGARALVLREERQVVGRVRDDLAARRHDAAQADAAAEREERICDRPGLAEDGDVPGRGRRRRVADPGGGAAGNEHPHAVRAEQHGARCLRRRCEPHRDVVPCRSGLGTDAGHDERAHPGRERVGKGVLDPLVVDEHEDRFRGLRQVADRRVAAQSVHLVAVRVHAPRCDAAAQCRRDRLGVTRRRTDDRDRARKEKRVHPGHRRILS